MDFLQLELRIRGSGVQRLGKWSTAQMRRS